MGETTISEDNFLWLTDSKALKYGIQKGFDTLVVHTLTYEYCILLYVNFSRIG